MKIGGLLSNSLMTVTSMEDQVLKLRLLPEVKHSRLEVYKEINKSYLTWYDNLHPFWIRRSTICTEHIARLMWKTLQPLLRTWLIKTISLWSEARLYELYWAVHSQYFIWDIISFKYWDLQTNNLKHHKTEALYSECTQQEKHLPDFRQEIFERIRKHHSMMEKK